MGCTFISQTRIQVSCRGLGLEESTNTPYSSHISRTNSGSLKRLSPLPGWSLIALFLFFPNPSFTRVAQTPNVECPGQHAIKALQRQSRNASTTISKHATPATGQTKLCDSKRRQTGLQSSVGLSRKRPLITGNPFWLQPRLTRKSPIPAKTEKTD